MSPGRRDRRVDQRVGHRNRAEDRLFGFCHWAARPGDLVALDSFYIGNLKGVGKVYQLTAIDTATRWAIIMIVLGVPNGPSPPGSCITSSAVTAAWASPCAAC